MKSAYVLGALAASWAGVPERRGADAGPAERDGGRPAANRPDVAEARLTINADDVNIQATKNALLPNLTASAYAQGVGLGGNGKQTPTAIVVSPGGFGDGSILHALPSQPSIKDFSTKSPTR